MTSFNNTLKNRNQVLSVTFRRLWGDLLDELNESETIKGLVMTSSVCFYLISTHSVVNIFPELFHFYYHVVFAVIREDGPGSSVQYLRLFILISV